MEFVLLVSKSLKIANNAMKADVWNVKKATTYQVKIVNVRHAKQFLKIVLNV